MNAEKNKTIKFDLIKEKAGKRIAAPTCQEIKKRIECI